MNYIIKNRDLIAHILKRVELRTIENLFCSVSIITTSSLTCIETITIFFRILTLGFTVIMDFSFLANPSLAFIAICIFSCATTAVEGFGTGSPTCFAGETTMLKMSDGKQNDPAVSFHIVPESGDDNIHPDFIGFRLEASPKPKQYTGFLLYAEDENGRRIGNFEHVGESFAQFVKRDECAGGSTITQYDAEPKPLTNVFYWRPPPVGSGLKKITFKGAVVTSYNEWYILTERSLVRDD